MNAVKTGPKRKSIPLMVSTGPTYSPMSNCTDGSAFGAGWARRFGTQAEPIAPSVAIVRPDAPSLRTDRLLTFIVHCPPCVTRWPSSHPRGQTLVEGNYAEVGRILRFSKITPAQ